MNIGILKENVRNERRIALTPAAAQSLIQSGHAVYVEKDAGSASHFPDGEFASVGASVVYSSDEVFGRSDMLLKISSPTESDCERLLQSQILFSFLHPAIAKTKTITALLRKDISVITRYSSGRTCGMR